MNRRLLKSLGVRQTDIAKGTGLSEALISRLMNGEVDPMDSARSTTDAILSFVGDKAGRAVGFDELFPKRRQRRAA